MSDADSLKREIFEKIAEFYSLEHGEQPFIPGQTKINYAGRVHSTTSEDPVQMGMTESNVHDTTIASMTRTRARMMTP